MKIRKVKTLNKDGTFTYKIQSRYLFMWITRYESRDINKMEDVYKKVMMSPNAEEV